MFFEGLLRTKQLLPEERTIVMNVLQRNAFWSHPENLILSLLADDNAAVRSDGVDRVLRLRHPIAEPVPVKIVYYRNLLNLMVPDLNWTKNKRERERETENERNVYFNF